MCIFNNVSSQVGTFGKAPRAQGRFEPSKLRESKSVLPRIKIYWLVLWQGSLTERRKTALEESLYHAHFLSPRLPVSIQPDSTLRWTSRGVRCDC